MADLNMTHTVEMLKTALPFVDPGRKLTMEVLLKVFELMGAFRGLRKKPETVHSHENKKADLESMLKSLKPVCSEKERSFVDQMLTFFQMKRVMEQYNSYMAMMDGKFPDFSSAFGNGFDLSSILNPNAGTPNPSAPPAEDSDLSSLRQALEEALAQSSDNDTESIHNSTFAIDENMLSAANIPSEDTDIEGDPPVPPVPAHGNGMIDTIKSMLPPEQTNTFENLRMLFNTMSYDNNENIRRSDSDGGNITENRSQLKEY